MSLLTFDKQNKKKWLKEGLLVLGASLFVWSLLDQNRFVVRKKELTTKKLRKGQSLRFVFVTDLHSKRFALNNEDLLGAIRRCKPDFILCGGDMMTAHPGKDNSAAISFIRRLSREFKIYYALGNHEYRARLYPETYGEMFDDYIDAIDSENITFLDNNSVKLPDLPVRISGLTVDRIYYKRFCTQFMPSGYIKNRLGPVKDDEYTILMAHNPEYGDEYFAYGADLFLSGHLHGGIIRLPFIGGLASPAIRLFPKYSGGLYLRGNKAGYVSCGLGTHTIPLRLNNPGEITCITIKGK